MSMSKKDFISLANAIKGYNDGQAPLSNRGFDMEQISILASFCHTQNSAFKKDRWLDYIAGERGPNGGAIKPAKRERGVRR